MPSRCLMRGGSISFVVVNIILLAVLAAILALRLPPKHRKENSNVHKYGGNVSAVVKQEPRTLAGFSDASDISRMREDLDRIYQREGNLRKPAIHLALSANSNTRDAVSVLTWQHLSNTTFQGEGVTYHNGSVIVTNGGYYYIYSTIRYSGDGTAELDYGRILHSILMQKESDMGESPTMLMQNLQSTPTIRRGRLAYSTNSLGATFYLPPNSRIKVTSSIPDNIDTSPFGSYFGAFLV